MPTGRTLLLADDSPTIRKVVSLTFQDEGLRVLTASSGGEALAQLEQDAPDIILADVHMPAPGGYELCARVKRDARLGRVPVLLLVGAFEPFDEAEARACGADGVLTKPFQSIRDLVSKVGGLLGGQPEAKSPDGDERAAFESRAESHAAAAQDEARRAREAAASSASQSEAAAGEAARPAFPDFDLDDESIETVPAESFAARMRAAAGDDEPQDSEAIPVVWDETPAADAAAAPFELADTDAPQAHAPQPGQATQQSPAAQHSPAASQQQDARSFAAAASRFGASPAPAAFEARAASAPAEDSLLDLDDLDSAPGADSDDLILDFDPEPPPARHTPAPFELAPDTQAAPDAETEPLSADAGARPEAAATHFEEAFPLFEEEARDEVSPAGISPANLSSAWKEPEQPEATAHADAVVHAFAAEAGLPAASIFESEAAAGEEETRPAAASRLEGEEHSFDAVPSAFDAVSASFEEEPAAVFAGEATAGSVEPVAAAGLGERGESAASETAREPLRAGGEQLSPEAIDAIARRVVEHLSERVLRDIAWEVVPDLAERLIRQRLEEEKLK